MALHWCDLQRVDEMSRKLTKSNFYLPEPRPPGRDICAWIKEEQDDND